MQRRRRNSRLVSHKPPIPPSPFSFLATAWLADKRPSLKSAPKAPKASSSKTPKQPKGKKREVAEDDHNEDQGQDENDNEGRNEANAQVSTRKSKKNTPAKRQRTQRSDSEYEDRPTSKKRRPSKMSNATPQGAEAPEETLKVGPPKCECSSVSITFDLLKHRYHSPFDTFIPTSTPSFARKRR